MRYTINEAEIRSENAAKSCKQKSKVVDSYLKSISGRPSILDFGCGKLRCSDTLISVASKVTFVDSEIQLSRNQIVRGDFTTVRDYIKRHYPGCNAISFEGLHKHGLKYDFITCINVLSAIPCRKTINKVLDQIHRSLKRNGRAVFICQHRSSYFKKFSKGRKWLYGYINIGKKGVSYYGILDKKNNGENS